MKTFIIYIASFLFTLVVFILPGRDKEEYTPLEAGTVYSVDSSTSYITMRPTTSRLFQTEEANLDTLYFFSEDTALPERFIGRSRPEAEANYIIASKETYKTKTTPKKVQPVKSAPKPKPKPVVKKKEPEIVKKEETEISFNYNILKTAVNNSGGSYFPENVYDLQDKASLIAESITPWRNKLILKFIVKNEQPGFFFIGGATVFNENEQFVNADFFHEALVGPGNLLEGYILLPGTDYDSLQLKLNESGGKNRTLAVRYVLP